MIALFNRTGYKTLLSQQRLACLHNCKLVWFQNSSSVAACTGYFESPVSWNKCLRIFVDMLLNTMQYHLMFCLKE
jgi:hypothetical protein